MKLSVLLALSTLGLLVACDDAGTDPKGGGGETTGSAGQNAGGSGSGGGDGGTGAGGESAGGSGGASACTPGSEQSCYTGPAGTAGVGLCSSGTRICLQDGSGFGECEGDVTPTTETCSAVADEDCDGETNEEGVDCLCVPGSMQDCYSAAPATLGVGLCVSGQQTCDADGLGWGLCEGEVTPASETCATLGDDDCDGETNEDGDDCVCLPGSVVDDCYSGPAGTEGVGACAGGALMCNDQGTAVGACVGETVPGFDDCATAADDDCDGSPAPACAANHLWSKRFGGEDSQQVTAVATDPAGNVVVAGYFQTSMDLGGAVLSSGATGVSAGFIAKLDPAGNHLWSKSIASLGSFGWPRSVATDPAGNVVMVGDFRTFGNSSVDFGGGPLTAPNGGDVFVVKFDPAGNHVWSGAFGGGNVSDEIAHDVAIDSSGNLVLTGEFDEIDFGGGALMATPPISGPNTVDAFVAKLDPMGNHLWSKRFGNGANQHGRGVAVDSVGNVVVTGVLFGAADFGGGMLTSAGNNDIFLAKFDPSGSHLWSKRFGGSQYENGYDVATDAANNVVITGNMQSANFGGGQLSGSIYIAKLAPDGNHIWSMTPTVGGVSGAGRRVTTDPAGHVLVTGQYTVGGLGAIDFGGGPLSASGGENGFIAKFHAAGGHLWSRDFNGAESFSAEVGVGVAVDALGRAFVTGTFSNTVDFGGGPLTTVDNYDVFLAKLAP